MSSGEEELLLKSTILEKVMYNESEIDKGSLEEVEDLIKTLDKEMAEFSNKVMKREYSFPQDNYEILFPGILVDIGNDLYFFDGIIRIIPQSIAGITLSRNLVADKYGEIKQLPQRLYEEILKGFGKEKEIGKKDLIALNFYSSPSEDKYSFRKNIFIHERGHLNLERKTQSQKWMIIIQNLMDKLSSVNLLIEKKKELEKELENYLSELFLCVEVYSFLTAPLYVLYKAYKGELATESAVNLLVKELNNLPYKVSKFYLHKNEIGKYISNEESIRTLVTSEKNKLEKIIRIIQTKRKDIEESLKYWIDEKLGKRLPEIENEIKI